MLPISMMTVAFLPMWMGAALFGIAMLAVLGGILIGFILVLKKAFSSSSRLSNEEAQMMQEIFQGLDSMEKRVETLETLLLDRERKDDS